VPPEATELLERAAAMRHGPCWTRSRWFRRKPSSGSCKRSPATQLALSGSNEQEPLRRSLAELQRLDARPAAAIVARRLRELGARGLPQGPRLATKDNPAGLTAREAEVLALVADGLRDAEIAERLVLSTRTVGHHVSAILAKLGVRTRAEASVKAVHLGVGNQAR